MKELQARAAAEAKAAEEARKARAAAETAAEERRATETKELLARAAAEVKAAEEDRKSRAAAEVKSANEAKAAKKARAKAAKKAKADDEGPKDEEADFGVAFSEESEWSQQLKMMEARYNSFHDWDVPRGPNGRGLVSDIILKGQGFIHTGKGIKSKGMLYKGRELMEMGWIL